MLDTKDFNFFESQNTFDFKGCLVEKMFKINKEQQSVK